jgi:hypothetical protein
MSNSAIARMRKHVETTIHRDILVTPDVRRGLGVLLFCRSCSFQVRISRITLVQSGALRVLLTSEEARVVLEKAFRHIPPRDGSAWAKILDEGFL